MYLQDLRPEKGAIVHFKSTTLRKDAHAIFFDFYGCYIDKRQMKHCYCFLFHYDNMHIQYTTISMA